METLNVICQACGDDLALLEATPEGPLLILASGLTPRTDGSAACPGCGQDAGVNFAQLQTRFVSTSKTS